MASFKLNKWRPYAKKIDPSAFSAALRARVANANKVIALFAIGRIRLAIRSGGFASNAALTAAVKGSTKPLYDRGELFRAITYSKISWRLTVIGAMQTAKTKTGKSVTNILEVLHDGATIRVTDSMRMMFFYLFLVTSGKMSSSKLTGGAKVFYDRKRRKKRVIYPLNDATSVIRIPKRPFIKQALDNEMVKKFIASKWSDAINAAL